MNNNFDTSTSGINIETSAYYDEDRAYTLAKETFLRLQNNERCFNATSTLLYIDNWTDTIRNVDTIYDMYECTLTKEQLLKEMDEVDDEYFDEEDTRLTYLKDTLGLTSSALYHRPLPEGVKLRDEFFLHASKGYGQGDFTLVYLLKEDDHLCEYIDNLLWDTPVYSWAEIDGQEFIYEPDNCYIWNKQEFIEDIMDNILADYTDEQLAYIKEQLNEQLPDALDF